ncbi:site-specific integrase [Streptomyces jumonjinensis]|uniref:Site-specific integrase n=1 Tax=Streptomyces jumonjinensis TaxID=1945 RepID=A0A646KR58_STRJU|nr:site-specific integrase [Streptomyces jumonjinensis]MQT03496.1 site-specific integrase [Streptomyces jumonjinensis]
MTQQVQQLDVDLPEVDGDSLSLAGAEVISLLQKFPPRPLLDTWPATSASREAVIERLRQPPLRLERTASQSSRLVGARWLLEWLETFPGGTWQQRWLASPAPEAPADWRDTALDWILQSGGRAQIGVVSSGLLALVCADVVRPHPSWLSTNGSRYLRPAIAAARDPEGFNLLEASLTAEELGTADSSRSMKTLAQVVAAHGGGIRDIQVGDLLSLRLDQSRTTSRSTQIAYQWLRRLGQFPHDAPATLRHLTVRTGQVSTAELVDRYRIQCRPIRDLIVDYLDERRPSVDYNTLKQMSTVLANNFWRNVELHTPGVSSLNLPPEAVTEWKARIATKIVRERQSDGSVQEVVKPRIGAPAILMLVRAFYLDIAHWAADEPGRWGPWVTRCPISSDETSIKKLEKQQKSRSDQRTRERLPVLPTLIRVAERRLKEASIRLEALYAAPFGSSFEVLGETFRKSKGATRSGGQPTHTYDSHGKRRDLGAEEKRAFWAWATIEILRHTGIRSEELFELSHHSIIQYKLPTTGEIVPLLHIAPSKTEEERLLLISPELADVLSAAVYRVRGRDGSIPVIPSYDKHERTWNSPMPLLYQWNATGEDRPLSVNTIRQAIDETLEASGLEDKAGKPLKFQPHDFRRIFITDAILNGMPPHIAQIIAGHGNINTTMGYNAVYPAAAIEAHRAFIARRRTLRPAEEYRAVTSEEWEEFLGHFERRKLSMGTCGRAYGTDCIHEHACIRCPVLIVDPDERHRLEEVHENLTARLAEAIREGWLADVEGLEVSQAAAKEKLARLDASQARRTTMVDLGIPTFRQLSTPPDAPAKCAPGTGS